jgi:MFS superfamily sulfate permease-like transporter
MDKRTDTSGAYDPRPLTAGRSNALTAAWTRVVAAGRDGLRDTIAGLVAAVVLIANIVSFGALMFPGNLSDGMPIAIWAMLIGSSIGGVWIALRTSLPPIATGIDSPTGAVLVLLGASAGSDIPAAGGSPAIAVQTVMLIFTAATVMSGALLYGLGVCRWGSYFRFVPYYLFGVLAGLLCACVMFTISYARLGVVRRHMTRAQFAGYVDRTAEAAAYLRENGDAIQIYWLSGYIFFGSSEGVLERIRGDIEALPRGRVAYVILDFSMASGADSSAVVSLAKLRNFCDQQGTTLVYCPLSPANHKALKFGGVFDGKSRHQAFADLSFALAWCEDRLLAKTNQLGIRIRVREKKGTRTDLTDLRTQFKFFSDLPRAFGLMTPGDSLPEFVV